jgi:hypothetical protein
MLDHPTCGMIRILPNRNVFQPSDARRACLFSDIPRCR